MKKSKVDDLGLTIEEELPLLYGGGNWNFHGVPSLGLNGISLRDGPLGLRMADVSTALDSNVTLPSTCYPSPSLLACSFDPSLLEEVGSSMGKDCRQNKVNVLLAPAINIKRNPLCGRNFEYYSEDPYLTTIFGGVYTYSLQVILHDGLNVSKRSTATTCSQRLRNTSPFTPVRIVRDFPLSRTPRSFFLACFLTQTRSLRILSPPI